MTMETIREFIRREPFEPFVIRLSNGEAHEVLHPECVALTKTKVVTADDFPQPDDSDRAGFRDNFKSRYGWNDAS